MRSRARFFYACLLAVPSEQRQVQTFQARVTNHVSNRHGCVKLRKLQPERCPPRRERRVRADEQKKRFFFLAFPAAFFAIWPRRPLGGWTSNQSLPHHVPAFTHPQHGASMIRVEVAAGKKCASAPR